ncbi:MAG TPA: hypothetical protein VM778_00135 [Gemmatimonadota bacterium]|nr:hypothetical protein [Gemmatimonadota bacterium]
MHYILLTLDHVELAARRFREHDNSPASIARHYRGLEDDTTLRACLALRRIERQYEINLGTICFKFLEKERRPTSRVQQQVMDYVAEWNELVDGTLGLVVSVDRVREIDRLAQGDGAHRPTSLDS